MNAVTNRRRGTGLLLALVVALLPAIAGEQDPLAGLWQGTLEVGGARLRLVLHLERDESGGYTGTMDSLDQGATGLPLAEIRLEDRQVSFALPVAAATFHGRLSEDGRRIDGTWSQGGLELALSFVRTETAPVLSRPQEPHAPFPYRVEEVRFESAPGVTLAGTLTTPERPGPHPAVVLISGSGPQDRDETVFGHRPFLVLADHLTRRGLAVLRFDDRGVGKSSGDFGTATSEDFARDVAAAVSFLEAREEIDPARIGLLGHSEGGIIAPMVARDRDDVAFVVLLAGTGVSGADLLVEQSARLLEAAGADPASVDEARAFQRQVVDLVLSAPGETEGSARDRLVELLLRRFRTLSEEERGALGLPRAAEQREAALRRFAERQAEQLLSPWFRFFLRYDPAPALRALRCPVLALGGSKDLQVPPDQNLPRIAEALAAAPTEDWTVAELPGLNHLFQTADTGSPQEYARIEQTFAPEALDRIAAWIAAHTAGD